MAAGCRTSVGNHRGDGRPLCAMDERKRIVGQLSVMCLHFQLLRICNSSIVLNSKVRTACRIGHVVVMCMSAMGLWCECSVDVCVCGCDYVWLYRIGVFLWVKMGNVDFRNYYYLVRGVDVFLCA